MGENVAIVTCSLESMAKNAKWKSWSFITEQTFYLAVGDNMFITCDHGQENNSHGYLLSGQECIRFHKDFLH